MKKSSSDRLRRGELKKVFSIIVSIVLACILVACSAPSQPASAPAQAQDQPAQVPVPEASNDYKIVVVSKNSSAPWFLRMETGVNQFASETGINAYQKGPAEFDAALQAQVVSDLIAQQVDALCVVPIDPVSMEPILKRAMDAGIVVVTHEASTQENTLFNLEAFTEADYGKAIMDNFAIAMGEEGKYITMVGGVTQVSQMNWADAAVERQKEAYPNMELMDTDSRVESGDDIEISYQVAKEMIKKHPDLKGICGTSAFDAPGVARAIDELGLKDKVFVTGTGVPSEHKQWIEKGIVKSFTIWDPAGSGYAMCVLATKILNGETIADGINLEYPGYESMKLNGKQLVGQGWTVIDASNIDSFDY